MGWSPEDGPTKEQAEIHLMKTRTEAYRMFQQLDRIKHKEKHDYLIQLYRELQAVFDKIDLQLKR